MFPFVHSQESPQNTRMADAATIAKLEEGFKKLEAATDCKSLLKKYLTKDVFEKLKAKKTSLGATLLDVIQSGKFKVSHGDKYQLLATCYLTGVAL